MRIGLCLIVLPNLSYVNSQTASHNTQISHCSILFVHICLSVITSGEIKLCAKHIEQLYSRVSCKVWVSIADDCLEKTLYFTTTLMNNLPSSLAVRPALSCMNLPYFKNMSTTTMIVIYMLDFCKKFLKPIVILSHRHYSRVFILTILYIVVALSYLIDKLDKYTHRNLYLLTCEKYSKLNRSLPLRKTFLSVPPTRVVVFHYNRPPNSSKLGDIVSSSNGDNSSNSIEKCLVEGQPW